MAAEATAHANGSRSLSNRRTCRPAPGTVRFTEHAQAMRTWQQRVRELVSIHDTHRIRRVCGQRGSPGPAEADDSWRNGPRRVRTLTAKGSKCDPESVPEAFHAPRLPNSSRVDVGRIGGNGCRSSVFGDWRCPHRFLGPEFHAGTPAPKLLLRSPRQRPSSSASLDDRSVSSAPLSPRERGWG